MKRSKQLFRYHTANHTQYIYLYVHKNSCFDWRSLQHIVGGRASHRILIACITLNTATYVSLEICTNVSMCRRACLAIFQRRTQEVEDEHSMYR